MGRPRRNFPKDTQGNFLCSSHIVGSQPLLTTADLHVLYHRLFKYADFAGIQIFTHSLAANHFSLVLRTPARIKRNDLQIHKHLGRFYGKNHPKTLAYAQAMKEPDSPLLQELRQEYLRRMGDLSVFMQELKQAFSKWFNFKHGRFGTLWAQRFTSIPLGVHEGLILYAAAYVDLQAVRIQVARDPAAHPFCGYARALAGEGPDREGLWSILPGQNWEEKMACYQTYLYGTGAQSGTDQESLAPERVMEELQRAGKLSVAQAFRLQVRAFSEGIALGTPEFLTEIHAVMYPERIPGGRQRGWPMTGLDWLGLMSLKKIVDPFAIPTPLTKPASVESACV